MQLMEEMRLECLAVVAGGVEFLGPMCLKQLERQFWVKVVIPKALHGQQTKTSLSSCEKGPFTRLGALA